MNLVNCDLRSLQINTMDKKIYCFGSGKYGIACANVMLDSGFGDKIEAFIDNDSERWGENFVVGDKSYPIISPDELLEKADSSYYILICCADVYGVCQQLDNIKKLSDTPVVIWQLVLSKEYDNNVYQGEFKKVNNPIIPKKIHYCWFGGKEIPEKLKKYMDSWKLFCPEYQIIRWDENNYDVNKNIYMKQAYETGNMGFVPDYARLDIIYEHGGIYLDTDVELISNLDVMLYQEAFCGFNIRRYPSLGLGFGAVRNQPIIKEMRDYYDQIKFIEEDGKANLMACDLHQYNVLKKYGVRCNNQYQEIKNMSIYPSTILDSKNCYLHYEHISDNTIAIHHHNLSWFTEKMNEDMNNRFDFFNKLNILKSSN
ncbi:glycosyltransferase family 32 protein [Lacrimispora xylanolytica]|uniref:Glycosyltransferase n=1 Tax=Lacrimispora xylanolytica TaxID=29375 RepID=A0ABY7ABN6_9FIRM|nr:glycosyltransferase [Lacrimispora xylanolytica]WAJ24095.1 glycosyltransferase [Lacrimispora xylanolytica]